MKKKIIIFTSANGHGHMSATQALQSYLSDEHEITRVFIFEEVFRGIDPIARVTFGKVNGSDVYNFFTRCGHYKMLNFLYNFGDWYFNTRNKSMAKIASNYLALHKPDLIISVVPVFNNLILEAAEKNKIPFLLIPTDFDVTSFVKGINAPKYNKFITTLASEDPLVKATVTAANLDPQQIVVTGLPIRKDFFEPKDKTALKKQLAISDDKTIIVLMMGGQVKPSILTFAKELAKLQIPAHLIFCISKNDKIKETIKKINFNSNISITILGFTEHISDLLAIADLLITKSGSLSFAEGLTMNIPMILDATNSLLYWERFNHTLLTAHHWGISLKKLSELNHAILTILGNPTYYQKIKNNLEIFPKKRFDQEIKPILEKLLTQQTTG